MRRVVGAALSLLAAAATATGAETVTYSKQIAPILWKHCAGCHRPGEVGPFSLLSCKDAARRAEFLKEITAERRMPPWKAEPGFGRFHDARRLGDEEIALIARWADAGAPEGDPRDLPPAPKFPEGWQLGTPDLVLKMPEPFEVPAGGPDVFRCFVIPTGLDEDRTVAAVEFRPGNRKVVHHALFFLDSTGQARAKDAADPKPGYASFGGIGILPTGTLGGWAPGAMPRPLPDGIGRQLKKGSDLVLQVHYHPGGKPESDCSSLGIYFTRTPPSRTKVLAGLGLVTFDIRIPPGERRYKREVSLTLPADVHAIGITPHMHWIGKEMKVAATLPDGRVEPLIWIKDWDFNWQGQYVFAEAVPLPKGARIDLVAYYDNSSDNPHNPSDPPKLVRFGEQTTDEMCLCGLQVVPDQWTGYAELAKLRRQERARAFLEAGGLFRRRAAGPQEKD
jgi:mono/diheme cytochrome c family protein